MADPIRRAYLPLHSNASAMLAGRPGRSVIARTKLLALVFDEVVLEDGSLEITLGEEAGIEGPAKSDTWTSAQERGRKRAAGDLIIQSKEGVETGRLSMTPAHYWRATFAPVTRDVGRSYPWLRKASVQLTEAGDRIAAEQVGKALGRPGDGPPVPVRDSVLYTAAARDLVAGAALDAVVSMDLLHQGYVRTLVATGSAAQATGAAALWVACPDLSSMSWEDIDDVRQHRGMIELRRVLLEIELRAQERAQSPREFERILSQELIDRAIEASGRSGLEAWIGAAKRAAVSTVIGLTPAAIPYSIAAEAREAWNAGGTWLAALSSLRAKARPTEGEETQTSPLDAGRSK